MGYFFQVPVLFSDDETQRFFDIPRGDIPLRSDNITFTVSFCLAVK
jgi:hypothetical protein